MNSLLCVLCMLQVFLEDVSSFRVRFAITSCCTTGRNFMFAGYSSGDMPLCPTHPPPPPPPRLPPVAPGLGIRREGSAEHCTPAANDEGETRPRLNLSSAILLCASRSSHAPRSERAPPRSCSRPEPDTAPGYDDRVITSDCFGLLRIASDCFGLLLLRAASGCFGLLRAASGLCGLLLSLTRLLGMITVCVPQVQQLGRPLIASYGL